MERGIDDTLEFSNPRGSVGKLLELIVRSMSHRASDNTLTTLHTTVMTLHTNGWNGLID